MSYRIVELRDVCTFKHGGTPSKANADFWQGTIPWVSPKDMKGAIIAGAEDHISEEAVANSATTVVAPSTVLVVVRSGILSRSFPVAVTAAQVAFNQDIKAILPDTENVDTWYLFWLLRAREPHVLNRGVKKGATVHSLRSGFLEQMQVPLPPLETQRRVAQALNEQLAAVERARAAVEARVEAARALEASLLRSVFTGREAQSWPSRSLEEVTVDTRNGLYKPDAYYGRGTPIVKMFNIGRLDGSWDLLRLDQVELTDAEHQAYKLRVGDVVINRVNSKELVGKCAVVDSRVAESVFESKNVRVRLDVNKASPGFVAFWLNSEFGRAQLTRGVKQIVGMATVNRSDLMKLRVPLPEMAEQQRVAERLASQVARAVEALEAADAELNEINSLPAALLRRAFGDPGNA